MVAPALPRSLSQSGSNPQRPHDFNLASRPRIRKIASDGMISILATVSR
jgi:hypothetical protein